MAYVIPRPHGRWELRESELTPRGPRSRTLASFRSLSPEVVDRAVERASRGLSADEIHQAARRAGAPVELPRADAAAADLLRELDRGRGPREPLGRLLIDALQRRSEDSRPIAETQPGVSDNARAAAPWVAATPAERGKALEDLLLLADAIPHRRDEPLRFPSLKSETA